MKRTASAVALLALLLVFAGAALVSGCGGDASGGASVPSDAVATVGDVSITKAQIQELINQASAQLKGAGDSFPAKGTAQYDEYMAKMVEYLVGNEIVAQSAPQFDVKISDAEVAGQIKEMVATYGGQATFDKTLKAAGMTQDLLKRTIKMQLVSQAVQVAATKSATVNATEIKAYWDAHKDQLSKDKKTATFAKAKTTIKGILLSAAQQKLWNEWMSKRTAGTRRQLRGGLRPGRAEGRGRQGVRLAVGDALRRAPATRLSSLGGERGLRRRPLSPPVHLTTTVPCMAWTAA